MRTILLSVRKPWPWYRQFPNAVPQWGECRFIFNSDDEDYDGTSSLRLESERKSAMRRQRITASAFAHAQF